MVEKLTDKIIDLDEVRSVGQASVDPDAGAAPIKDHAEIRKRVQEKIEEAKAQDPGNSKKDSGNGGNLSSNFIQQCLDANVLGDSDLYTCKSQNLPKQVALSE